MWAQASRVSFLCRGRAWCCCAALAPVWLCLQLSRKVTAVRETRRKKSPVGKKTQRRLAWARSAHPPSTHLFFSAPSREPLHTDDEIPGQCLFPHSRWRRRRAHLELLSAIWRPWLPRRGYIHCPSPNNHCTRALGSSWPVSRSSG